MKTIVSGGAPESLFLFLVLASLLFFERKQYVLAGLFGGLSVMTKTPGILLFPAYLFVFLEQRFVIPSVASRSRGIFHTLAMKMEIPRLQKSSLGMTVLHILEISLIPLSLILVFTFYQYRYNDFFAYFHTNGVVPMPYPFSAFNFQQKWVGSAWLEDIALS